MQLMVISGIAVLVCGVIFALQNNVPVTVTFLVWRFDSSLAMVLMLALALGAIIVALVSAPTTLRSRWTIARLRTEVAKLKAARDELGASAARSADPERAGAPLQVSDNRARR